MNPSGTTRLADLEQKKRVRKVPKVTGRPSSLDTCKPTPRQYDLLQILYRYGWCTSDLVHSIASIHNVKVADRRIRHLLWQLEQMSLVKIRKLNNGTRKLAYAISETGVLQIENDGDNLLCTPSALTDPAGIPHFLALHHIMLRFRQACSVRHWLTDFEVRSERMDPAGVHFAKDYDAVTELQLPTGAFRAGIEYETKQQQRAWYQELCASMSAEPHLDLVLYFVKRKTMLSTISLDFVSCRIPLGFVEADQFLEFGMASHACYWVRGEMQVAALGEFLKAVPRRALRPLVPSRPLSLGHR